MDANISTEVELQRCSEDFIYFCENYVKITRKNQLVNFSLYDYQKRYVKAIEDNRFLLCKKFRQGEFSTLGIVWATWKCLFTKDQSILHLSKTDREAINCGYVAKRVLDGLPEWMKPKLDKDNDHVKSFATTKSNMFFYTPEAARGKSITHLFLDEVAFIQKMDQHWKAVWPTISNGGKCTAISTPNGTSGWFYETYTQAEQLKNDFTVFRCNYLEHPDYSNEKWIANTKQNLGAKGWAQEVLAEFLIPDKRTQKQKIDDSFNFFEETLAAEEFVKSISKKHPEQISNVYGWTFDSNNLVEDIVDEFVPPKPKKEELPRTKPEVYQFRKMTLEEQKAFIQDYESRNTYKVEHDEFDDFSINETKDLVDFWAAFVDVYPHWNHVKEFWEDKYNTEQEKIKFLEEKVDENITADMLAMAGVISASEAKSAPNQTISARPDRVIIDKINSSGRYHKKMNLSFQEGRLCVNCVPTIIKEEDVRDLYNGIFSLVGYDQAIDYALDAITSKLDNLFLLEGKDESVVKETLK